MDKCRQLVRCDECVNAVCVYSAAILFNLGKFLVCSYQRPASDSHVSVQHACRLDAEWDVPFLWTITENVIFVRPYWNGRYDWGIIQTVEGPCDRSYITGDVSPVLLLPSIVADWFLPHCWRRVQFCMPEEKRPNAHLGPVIITLADVKWPCVECRAR